MKECLRIESERELEEWAGRLAEKIKSIVMSRGLDVALDGALGAGKTTFVRYFAKACHVKEPVSSPSYVLQHEYHNENGLTVEHWDLYRLRDTPEELFAPPAPGVIRIVEWASHAPEFSTKCSLKIFINLEDTSRVITAELKGPEKGK